jgi:deoxycytidine triphosphate deaminase
MSVLIDKTIDKRFKEVFQSGASKGNIRAAKYYLTLGEDLLFLPDGQNYMSGQRRQRFFTLLPGQSAVVSTKERISMPADLLGIIGPRYENSERGLLFFGGMIVDPGYGLQRDEFGRIDGEPLFVTIANVGDKAIELRPGKDFIASIAFLSLERAIDEKSLRSHGVVQPANQREEEIGDGMPFRPLGFVEELERMKVDLDKVAASTMTVVLFGVIVLSVTLCAAIIGALFAASGHFEVKETLARSIGLSLGVVFAAIVLASGLFYVWVAAIANKRGLNRTYTLKRSSN